MKYLLFLFFFPFALSAQPAKQPVTPPIAVAPGDTLSDPVPVWDTPVPNPPRSKEPIIHIVDEPAEFPGGNAALRTYIQQHLVYPATAREKGIEGKCYVRFVVDREGRLSDIKVSRGVYDCPECDQEAIRLVQSMPNWKPGKTNGKAVDSYFNLPIRFGAE